MFRDCSRLTFALHVGGVAMKNMSEVYEVRTTGQAEENEDDHVHVRRSKQHVHSLGAWTLCGSQGVECLGRLTGNFDFGDFRQEVKLTRDLRTMFRKGTVVSLLQQNFVTRWWGLTQTDCRSRSFHSTCHLSYCTRTVLARAPIAVSL